MRVFSLLFFVLVCFLVLPSAQGKELATPDAPDAAYFARLIGQRLEAVSSGDRAGYMALMHPELVHISDTGTRRNFIDMAAYIASVGSTAAVKKTFTVTEAQATVRDGLAFVDAVITETQDSAGNQLQGQFRESDVLIHENGQWVFWRHHETLLPFKAKAVAVDPKLLTDYTGRYEYLGSTDTIAVKAGELWISLSDPTEAPIKLQPITEITYLFEDDLSHVTFVRDSTGVVVGYEVSSLNGMVASAKKVP